VILLERSEVFHCLSRRREENDLSFNEDVAYQTLVNDFQLK
jgi:hypothetical protein